MKKVIKYLFPFFLLAGGIIFTGCNSPQPTELIQDNSSSESQVQYQVITKDPTDVIYSNGFDTTGVTTIIPDNVNVINISGTKVTENNTTRNFSFAQALFFDRSRPVTGPGGHLVGYKTSTPGMLKFNGVTADSTPFRVRFSYNGNVLDSLLGSMYVLNNQFNFGYNSQIYVQFYPGHTMHGNPNGNSIGFYIPTPKEIKGSVKVTGRLANKSLSAEVDWNKVNGIDSVELVLGAVSKKGSIFPLYKLRTLDSGKLIIPPRLLNEIPAAQFNKLVFTFVRRIKMMHSERGNDLFVLSQSIHSIILDIP